MKKIATKIAALAKGKIVKFSFALAVLAIFSGTCAAQPVIFDNFDREDGILAGSTTSDGNGTWDSGSDTTSYEISGNAAMAVNNSNSNRGMYLAWEAPTDAIYSVEATVTRSLGGTNNHSHGIGFVDGNVLGTCGSTGCAQSLTMAVDIGGNAYFWHNGFAQLLKGPVSISEAGLDVSTTDPFPVKVEIDPTTNTARGIVNDVELLNLSYDPSQDGGVVGAGVYNSSTGGAIWDDFAIRSGPGTPVYSRTWRADKSGGWSTAGNWTPGGIPDDNNTTAVFGDAISESRVVYTTADVTVNAVQFASAHAYAVTGIGTITLAAGTVATAIDVFLGDHQFQAAVKLDADMSATIGAGSSLTMNNLLDLNGNTLTKQGSGTLNINNRLVSGVGGSVVGNGGTIRGDGTVGGDLSNNAAVAPGNSPGILSVDGNYTQSAGGTLEIELASNGGVAGIDHDRLAVTLAASLDGTLDLQLDGGYTPTIGDSFAGIVTAGALSGQFATTSNVVIDGRRGVAVTYTGMAVDAQIGLRGNTDIATGDIDVDTSDLTTSIINFTSAGGAGKTWADGDTDGDGDVDTSDLTTSIINFTSALGTAQAVPEPNSLVLFSLGMLLVLRFRRRS